LKTNSNISKSLWLLLSSVALSAVTIIFGAAPLKAVRHILGAGPFWLLGLGLSVIFLGLKLPALAIILLLFTVAVGIWTQLEESGFDLAQSALGGLVSAATVAFGLFYTAIQKDQGGWYKKLIASTEGAMAQFSAVEVVKNMKVEDLVLQLPAMITIGLLISIALAAVLERPIANWAGVPVRRKERLTDFRLPDFMIWAVIGSLFGAFWQGSPKVIETLSLNVLNVSLVLYFFQGMAVLCKYCIVFRVGTVWRTILIVVFTLQLFFILSLVGVIDFWADFRKQFTKKSADLKKRIN
jgi:hypothetical protein